MKPRVHILASHLPGGNLDATLLVFKTLRIGFPTAIIYVYANRLSTDSLQAVKSACEGLDCTILEIGNRSYDLWIEALINEMLWPFWVCDTDVVFHRSVEGFTNKATVLKGRHEPAFLEPWSGTEKTERLHTSLLYLNAPVLRRAVWKWVGRFHPKGFPFTPEVQLIRQCYMPQGVGKPARFQDTCAGLYLALGGEKFSDEENKAYDHLHCSTYVQEMCGAIPGLATAHQAVYADTTKVNGMQEIQNQFYKENYAAD